MWVWEHSERRLDNVLDELNPGVAVLRALVAENNQKNEGENVERDAVVRGRYVVQDEEEGAEVLEAVASEREKLPEQLVFLVSDHLVQVALIIGVLKS